MSLYGDMDPVVQLAAMTAERDAAVSAYMTTPEVKLTNASYNMLMATLIGTKHRGDTYRARALALLKRCAYLRSERDANDGMQDAFNLAMKNSDGWKFRATTAEARCAELEPEVKACHEIMRQVRIVCGDEYTGTMDAVKGLHQRCAALERLLSAARAYRDAELHCVSHKSTCRAGCDLDTGADCAGYGDLWLAEMRARKAMWDALDALSLAPQTDGGKEK